MNNIHVPSNVKMTAKTLLLFARARRLQAKAEAHARANRPDISGKNIVKAVHCYQAAFDDGLLDAGVNLLSIVVRAMLNSKAKQPNEPVLLQDRALEYITALEEAGYEEGTYYRALCLIHNLLETGNTIDSDRNNGLMLMNSLADDGYAYAIEYLDTMQAKGNGN